MSKVLDVLLSLPPTDVSGVSLSALAKDVFSKYSSPRACQKLQVLLIHVRRMGWKVSVRGDRISLNRQQWKLIGDLFDGPYGYAAMSNGMHKRDYFSGPVTPENVCMLLSKMSGKTLVS